MEKLSPRQQAVLDYIKEAVEKRGYPPSVREIGEGIGLRSSSTVHAHLSKLEQKGHIRRDPTKPRAIEIIGSSPSSVPSSSGIRVPILGQVTAGAPILAEQNIETYIDMPADFVKPGANQFCLRIKGDSMIDAGIVSGDLVLVRQQSTAEKGEIVVALLDNEATVKRYYPMADTIKLQPENPSYQPIFSSDVVVLGKVVGVFRLL